MRTAVQRQSTLGVENLTKNYEGKPLINRITFSVFDQEILCLLGPSGSGKSTLLRIIAGLEPFEGGQVSWRGKNLLDVPPEHRSFGLMFQDYALFPHLTVYENVAFGLRMQHLPEQTIQHRVKIELERVSMNALANRKVQNLSGGEQQRIALARTLAPKPKLIMLDEPLGALDRKLREQLTREIRLILKSTGVPAIYVTHDQEEALSLADRILLLSGGRIAQLGTPEELYHSPRSSWVANFLGLGTVIGGIILTSKPLRIRTALGDLNGRKFNFTGRPGTQLELLIPMNGIFRVSREQPGIVGTVSDCIYQGDHYLAEVRVKTEKVTVSLQDFAAPGTRIKLAVDENQITLFETH